MTKTHDIDVLIAEIATVMAPLVRPEFYMRIRVLDKRLCERDRKAMEWALAEIDRLRDIPE